MDYKGIYKVLNISWGWMVLLFIVFPIVFTIVQFVLGLISVFMDYTINFPVILLPLFSILGVFFWWLWVIGERLNRLLLGASKLDSKWFRASMYLWITLLVISFLYVLTFNLLAKIEIYAPHWVENMLAILMLLFMLAAAAAYCYNVYFVSNVLKIIFKGKEIKNSWGHDLPYFAKVWVFPFGIPLINAQIKNISNESK